MRRPIVNIRLVETRSDLNSFIRLPYRFYRDDPVWVPPLRSEQRSQFDPRRNPMLDHCEYALFLLEDNQTVVGRIAAFTHRLAVDFWREPIGLFGYYECIPDDAASRILLQTAADWLRKRGMTAIRGPWTFVSQEWGLVVEGFTPPPVMMAPYNPPYYHDQMTAFGLARIKDLLCYYISGSEGY
jgi:hypothetical protein